MTFTQLHMRKPYLKNPLFKLKKIVCIMLITLLYACESTSFNSQTSETSSQVSTLINTKITTNTTLTNDKIWLIDGIVSVENGATLGISEGTIIKFSPTIYDEDGNIVEISALVISDTGKINAEGSLNNPIIFTSALDNIEIGQKTGTSLDISQKGKWGGILICGKAELSNNLEQNSLTIIPNTTAYNYGGTQSSYDQGTLSYVSIRHSGNEHISGLTLAAVGQDTEISNIEVIATTGDGYTFLGGSVDCQKCITTAHSENGISIQSGYKGTIETFAVIHSEESQNALNITGSNSPTTDEDMFTISNGTIVGNQTSETNKIGSIEEFVKGKIKNIFITQFNSNSNSLNTNSNASQSITSNDIEFENIELYINSTTKLESLIDEAIQSQESFTENFLEISENKEHNQGIFPEVFSWTQSETTNLIDSENITPTGLDSDNDGMNNELDLDDDNDGVIDTIDLDPTDPSILADTDGDKLPDSLDIFAYDPTITKTLSDINKLIDEGNYTTIQESFAETHLLKLHYIHASLYKFSSINQQDTINKYFYKYGILESIITEEMYTSEDYIQLIDQYNTILESIVNSFEENSQIAYLYNTFLNEIETLNLINISTYEIFLAKHTIWQFCTALISQNQQELEAASNYYAALAPYLNTQFSTTLFTTGSLVPESFSTNTIQQTEILSSFKITNHYLKMLREYTTQKTQSLEIEQSQFFNTIYFYLHVFII